MLKAENDRLKVAPGPSSGSTPGQVPGSSALSSPRRSLGLALSHPFSPSLTDTGTCLRRACVGRKRKGKGHIYVMCHGILDPGGNGVETKKIPLSVSTMVPISSSSIFGKENNYKVWGKAESLKSISLFQPAQTYHPWMASAPVALRKK